MRGVLTDVCQDLTLALLCAVLRTITLNGT